MPTSGQLDTLITNIDDIGKGGSKIAEKLVELRNAMPDLTDLQNLLITQSAENKKIFLETISQLPTSEQINFLTEIVNNNGLKANYKLHKISEELANIDTSLIQNLNNINDSINSVNENVINVNDSIVNSMANNEPSMMDLIDEENNNQNDMSANMDSAVYDFVSKQPYNKNKFNEDEIKMFVEYLGGNYNPKAGSKKKDGLHL
jgi:hypothetical protein